MKKNIKILLADDELLFRKAIAFLLQHEDNIDVVFEASNGIELIEFLKVCNPYPDIILMDLKMPELDGVQATKIINKKFPEIKIIALTSYNTKSFIANMLEVGAAAYLVKNASPKEMLITINEVYNKGFYYNDKVIEVIEENYLLEIKEDKGNLAENFISEREKQILFYLCKQFNAVEISELLFISPRTVDGHRNSLLLKTNSKNIAGLVVFAIQNKIIDLKEL